MREGVETSCTRQLRGDFGDKNMQRLGNNARGSRAESEDQRRPRSGPRAGHVANQAESLA